MTTTTCSRRACGRPATYTDRDGHSYCKRHSDRLPSHLRHRRTPPKVARP